MEKDQRRRIWGHAFWYMAHLGVAIWTLVAYWKLSRLKTTPSSSPGSSPPVPGSSDGESCVVGSEIDFKPVFGFALLFFCAGQFLSGLICMPPAVAGGWSYIKGLLLPLTHINRVWESTTMRKEDWHMAQFEIVSVSVELIPELIIQYVVFLIISSYAAENSADCHYPSLLGPMVANLFYVTTIVGGGAAELGEGGATLSKTVAAMCYTVGSVWLRASTVTALIASGDGVELTVYHGKIYMSTGLRVLAIYLLAMYLISALALFLVATLLRFHSDSWRRTIGHALGYGYVSFLAGPLYSSALFVRYTRLGHKAVSWRGKFWTKALVVAHDVVNVAVDLGAHFYVWWLPDAKRDWPSICGQGRYDIYDYKVKGISCELSGFLVALCVMLKLGTSMLYMCRWYHGGLSEKGHPTKALQYSASEPSPRKQADTEI